MGAFFTSCGGPFQGRHPTANLCSLLFLLQCPFHLMRFAATHVVLKSDLAPEKKKEVDGKTYACGNVECSLFVAGDPYTRCKSCRKFSLKSCPSPGCPFLLVHCSSSNYSTYVIDHLMTHPEDVNAQALYNRLIASRDAVLSKKRVAGSKVTE